MQHQTILIFMNIICLCFVDCQDSVYHHDESAYTTEGQLVTLNCGYTVSVFRGLFWYRHKPGEKLELLISLMSDRNQTKEKFTAELQKKNSRSFLNIKNPSVTDSASYLCAVDTSSYSKLVFGKGTNLIVTPKIEDSVKPTVNIIKNKEQPPKSACVATGYPSPEQNTTATVNDKEMKLDDKFILQNFNNKWIYSTVVWDHSEELKCSIKYKETDYEEQSILDEDSETCSLVSEVSSFFETDTKLNSLSLTALGLRVFVIKALIFNLLITLRLWSS